MKLNTLASSSILLTRMLPLRKVENKKRIVIPERPPNYLHAALYVSQLGERWGGGGSMDDGSKGNRRSEIRLFCGYDLRFRD